MSLVDFIRESNAIEGIGRLPTAAEISAAECVMGLSSMSVEALNGFQVVMAPGKPLRTQTGMDVRVGEYIPPPGGPNIEKRLNAILHRANLAEEPWHVHCRFEMLHPYMDGNGRTGRILWAWQMQALRRDPFALPFLQRWYYQTLENSR